MIKTMMSPIIHIMTKAGRFYRTLLFLCSKLFSNKPNGRLKKYAPGSLDHPLVRHRDYDLDWCTWDE
jgi:hypothetical protein